METKALIRKRALTLRDALTEDERKEKSDCIVKKVVETAQYNSAGILFAYVSCRSEVETEQIIRKALEEGKEVYCPKVWGERMDFYRILDESELCFGYRGIKEPEAHPGRIFDIKRILQRDKADFERILMLMPGSAFDEERNRIGYGKGYYDKYLREAEKLCREAGFPFVSRLQTVALCFDCQIQQNIPAESHDWKPELVITEGRSFSG